MVRFQRQIGTLPDALQFICELCTRVHANRSAAHLVRHEHPLGLLVLGHKANLGLRLFDHPLCNFNGLIILIELLHFVLIKLVRVQRLVN